MCPVQHTTGPFITDFLPALMLWLVLPKEINMGERRYDMDWIRVIVFDVLIFWHVGLFFVEWEGLVPWDLPLKNNVQVSWLLWPMLFVRQWRLPILFVISGIGTHFLLSSKSGGTFLKQRFIRLFVPLLVGTLIVVPPQVYLERLAHGTIDVSYFDYYPSNFEGTYPKGNFSWGHLWFLAYLLIMSVMALPLFLFLRNYGAPLFRTFKRMIERLPYALFLFVIPLIIIEITLEKRFPLTMALKDDWYAFNYYYVCFFAGFFLANLGDPLWKAFVKMRYPSLIMGLLASVLVVYMLAKGQTPLWVQVLKPLNVWCWILAIFGFSSRYLNRKSKVLAYRNVAVYPFYILHFTITLFLGYQLKELPLHYVLKMILMIIGTFGFSWLLYEYVIRRIKLLRPLFGLKTSKVSAIKK